MTTPTTEPPAAPAPTFEPVFSPKAVPISVRPTTTIVPMSGADASSAPTPKPTEDAEVIPALCLKLGNGEITEIIPTETAPFVSECIFSDFLSSHIFQIKASFARSLPSIEYRSLVLSSEPLTDNDTIDGKTGTLKQCRDICDALKHCQCIEGTQNRDGNALYFITEPMRIKSAILSLLTDHNEMDSVQFSMFDARIAGKSQAQSLHLAPHRIITALLNNGALTANARNARKRKIVMKLPNIEADEAQLELTAIPLILDDPSKRKEFTKSCTVKDSNKCAVIVHTAFDYKVEVFNKGLVVDGIQMFHQNVDEDNVGKLHHGMELREIFAAEHDVDTVQSSLYLSIVTFGVIVVILIGFFIKPILQCFRKKRRRTLIAGDGI